jgi:hypothetical protein
MTAVEWLKLGVQQYLHELSDDEYRKLIAVARPLEPQSEVNSLG